MIVNGRTFDPLQLFWGAFSSPLFSFLIALAVGTAILVFTSRPASATRISRAEPRTVYDRYTSERRTLGVVAILVATAFVAEFIIRGYVLTGPELAHWGRFAIPLACAVLGLGFVLGMIATRGTTPPEAPVVSVTRRNWKTFSTRSALGTVSAVALTLIATTVLAGLASSTNDEGEHVWLAIPIPNEDGIDPIRQPFYGWAYGLPVLICLTALGAVFWAALDRNSARPFLRPETVAAERTARRATATGVSRIAVASMLLALAGAWRLISRAGSGVELTIMGQNENSPYEAAWKYAEFAIAAGWLAPLLEVIAITLLLLVAANGLIRSRTKPHFAEDVDTPASVEAAS